jgi:predicted nucleic acid-binding protein
VTGDLLDTSVVIAPVHPGALPRNAAISVLTVAELVAGVRLARTDEQRSSRGARLDAVRAVFAPLPVDEEVAEQYGELLAFARTSRRTTQATDLLIAATAAAHDRTLITRDERQAALVIAAGLPARVVA